MVCLITCIILYKDGNLIYDLALACFGSALLGIVVALAGYTAERRIAMEKFVEEIRKAIAIIDDIPLIEITDDVLGALRDENSSFPNTTQNIDRLKSYIECTLPINENTTDEQIYAWVERDYQGELENARKQLRKAAEAYIKVGEFDISDIDFAYGQLEFLFGNKTVRKDAFKNLYNKIRNIRQICSDQCRVFKAYLAGHGNKNLVIEIMFQLQNMIFENRNGEYYAVLRDDLKHDLVTFRNQIYNTKIEYQEPFPVRYSNSIYFEESEYNERYRRYLERAQQEGRDESTMIIM